MHIEVGSYKAKTKLPELLRGVQAGITLRGNAVANLVPAECHTDKDTVAAVEDMLSFMEAHHNPVGDMHLKALINAGRA